MPASKNQLKIWRYDPDKEIGASDFPVPPSDLLDAEQKLFCKHYLTVSNTLAAYLYAYPEKKTEDVDESLAAATEMLRDPLIHKCLDYLMLSDKEVGISRLKSDAQAGARGAAKALMEVTTKEREGRKASSVWLDLMIEAGAYVVKPFNEDIQTIVMADSPEVFDRLPNGAIIEEGKNGKKILKFNGGLALACPLAVLVQGPGDYSAYAKNALSHEDILDKPYDFLGTPPPEGMEDLASFDEDERDID